MTGTIIIEEERRPAGRGEGVPCDAGAAGGSGAPARGKGDRLLWIVAGAFALLLIAWTTFIIIACRHPVAPLSFTTQGGGSR